MKAIVTLDYELFFGARTGSPEKCLFEPTDALLAILNRFAIKATFFVDVAYLDAASSNPSEMRSAEKIRRHLDLLVKEGHDIQLHLHPHWYFSSYVDSCWQINKAKYKLSDLSHVDAVDTIRRGCDVVKSVSGESPIAYRAGGWCIDGFASLADTFYEQGIRVDSTVYAGGYNRSEIQGYDFRKAPLAPEWDFHEDPLNPLRGGRFVELPISSVPIAPLFYWKRVINKLRKSRSEAGFGDGVPTGITSAQLSSMLLFGACSVTSIDGPKALLLSQALRHQIEMVGEGSNFVVLGHPKALTRQSLSSLDSFFACEIENLDFSSVKNWHRSRELHSAKRDTEVRPLHV